jgi:hypothetical protein
MSEQRIGRRLALRARLQNPYSQAVSTKTLARKVSHYLCHPFSPWCGGQRLVGKVEPSMVAPPGGGTYWSTGVRPFRGRGGARRFGCSATSGATPFSTASLVTKGKKHGGVQ